MQEPHDSPTERGFVWGQIYIGLMILFGAIYIVWSIVVLSSPLELNAIVKGSIIGFLVYAILGLLSAIGVWGRWKWGLYLVYFLMACNIVGTFVLMIMRFMHSIPGGWTPTNLSIRIILYLLHLLIASLWIGYFYRRRTLFR